MIKFSGSKKKKNSGGTDTPDNLRSDDNGELIIGLCEGPIEGLEDGGHSFYLDGTPLWNSEGEDNFESYSLDIKSGDSTQDESIKYSLGGAAVGHTVGLNIEEPGAEHAITRQTNSANIDYIDVRVAINALYNASSNGTSNATGKFRIEWKKSNLSEWNVLGGDDITISGKTTSQYVRDYRITVERDNTQNVYYEVRVTRISQASSLSQQGYHFVFAFSQYEEIDASAVEFKDTAICHFTLKTTDNVTSLPEIYGVYKLLKVKVPTNYDPETHTYNGVWDGTFKIAWTDNPAWCLYDLIINTRYGVNAYYPVTPDKWDFYEASKYCDELVSDGAEGTEPRYTLNYLITDSQPGPEMLNYIAGTFNGIIYEDSSGMVRLAIEDNNKPAVAIFNPTNVTADGFSYSFTDISTRYNDFTVSFVNPDLKWETDRRRVIEPYGEESIIKWGRIPFDYNAIGCIKESEALRKTRFKLITAQKETMTVQFTTNRFATAINLFDTILISDPDMNYAQSGRFKSIGDSRTEVELRDPVYLESGASYELHVQTSYNVFICDVQVKEYGHVTRLYLGDILPSDVDEKAVFVLDGTDKEKGHPKPFRVVSISEAEGAIDRISITATEIYRNKQIEADTGIVLENSDASTIDNYATIPQILNATFMEYYNTQRLQNGLVIGIELDWDNYPYYTGDFIVYSRLKVGEGEEENAWQQRNVENGDTIFDHPSGLHEFIILPKTTLGLYPDFGTAKIFEFDVSEIAAEPPVKVENFHAEGNINNIYLTWDKVENAINYELRIGEEWETGEVIATGLSENSYYYTAAEANVVYKFLIKAYNTAGLNSDYAAVDYGTLSAPKDVKKFYVTPNLDNIRFDWVAEAENNVSYEVRIGAAWESGIRLFVSDTDNHTILSPGQFEDTYFFIKALSSKGIYSNNALFANLKQNLKQNRNVIRTWDNVADDWIGISHGLIDYDSQDEESLNEIKVMADNYFHSEHFWTVSFEEKTIARNWYENEFFKFGERLKWEDLDFAWNSDEGMNTSWLNEQDALNYGGTLQRWICTKKDTNETYNEFLGLRFNETTTGMNGETPEVSETVKYDLAKVSKGLALGKTLKLKYDISGLPQLFSLRFRLYVNAGTPEYFRILRLEGSSGDIDCWIENGRIYVQRSDNIICSGEITWQKYIDWISVMITQESDKLRLDYSVQYANISNSTEVNCTPLGNFNKLYLGYRYD